MTVDEYIPYEWTADCRHEYDNGRLFEVPAANVSHSHTKMNLMMFSMEKLEPKGYEVYCTDLRVSNHNKTSIFYPDVFVTKELQTEANEYIQCEPEIIFEVIMPHSRVIDTVCKYLEYKAIPSMKYHLIIAPKLTYVTVHAKNEEGSWQATLYSSLKDVIPLPLLDISLPLSKIYK